MVAMPIPQTNAHEIADIGVLEARTSRLVAQNTSLDWNAVTLNILALPFVGAVFDVDDKSALAGIAVEDEWLATASRLPVISREGMELLAKGLEKKGWISVAEAERFVKIERDAFLRRPKDTEPEAASREGAAMLLARAEKELPGTLKRIAEGAGDLADAAKGVLMFSTEAAIFAGKGVGALAGWMRHARIKS